MEPSDQQSHSFIVKVWSERTGRSAQNRAWRGRITHVPSGERRSIQRIEEIGMFMTPYLIQLGLRVSWSHRLLHLILHRRRPDKRSNNDEESCQGSQW